MNNGFMPNDKVKKLILFRIPMSICNFRCHYCYLAQRPIHFEGVQPEMKYTPEQVAYAIRPERLGGYAYINLCADGETLLVKDIDIYARKMVESGHFLEIVSNMTITPVLEKILSWPKELLEHVEFKCSFHYLELKKHNKLALFAENIHKVWSAGASANIEITPSDELIPYIDEVMEFSMKEFGALPHITIARDDRTDGIDYLTSLPMEEYDRAWSRFGSGFWEFKKTIFGKRQTKFCYAGAWSAYVDLTTGNATQCYCGQSLGNVFENPEMAFPEKPIGRCSLAHCYNGHVFLSWGLIPGYAVRYGDIRNRLTACGGGSWLRPELHRFFNSKLEESNDLCRSEQIVLAKQYLYGAYRKSRHLAGRFKNKMLGR